MDDAGPHRRAQLDNDAARPRRRKQGFISMRASDGFSFRSGSAVGAGRRPGRPNYGHYRATIYYHGESRLRAPPPCSGLLKA